MSKAKHSRGMKLVGGGRLEMRASKGNDGQVWQLIKERMDELRVTVLDVAERDFTLAQLIKKGIAGYPATIDDGRLYKLAQLLGLTTHRHASERIPSRDDLIALFKYGESTYPYQSTFLVDWGCE